MQADVDRHHRHHLHSPHDSGDDGNLLQSADDRSDLDADDSPDVVRNGNKRKRPISVSCELCKQRKVKCDRGQPSCGWCSRNNAPCEYKERKKPGLRAGYGRELEQRLDKLEAIIRHHSDILQNSPLSFEAAGGGGVHGSGPAGAMPRGPPSASFRGSNASLPSDHGTPREPQPHVFAARPDSMRTPQAETALFLQKPSTYGAPPTTQGLDFGIAPPTPSLPDGFSQAHAVPVAGFSPTHTHATGHEFYAAGAGQAGSGSATLPSPSISMGPGPNVGGGQSHMTSDQELPPYDLLYALVDLYFKHINTWCPILHRKTTLDSLFGPSMMEETDKILLHAIVATTLRFSTDARLTEERRQHYHDVSKRRVLLYGMENSSVKALQAMVVLALDLCGSSNGPPGWNIMALITRSVVQLGLAVESNSFSVTPGYASIYTLRAMWLPEPRDFVEEESRRRLFWMVYLLDRYATISTAFDFGLDDKDIDRTLPCRDDLWIKNQKVETRWFRTDDRPEGLNPDYKTNRPENLGTFGYYVEILGILSKVHKFLKQPVDISALSDVEQWQMAYKELDSMLNGWKFELPGDYGNMAKMYQPGCAKTLNCGWVMLHATYHTAVIRLNSSAAYPTTRSPIFTPSYSASQRCHNAVENIAALGEFVLANGLLPKLGPPFAFTLWVAARLLLVHGSTIEHKLSGNIQFFVNTLREMGRYWPVAARYLALLERVLDEHRDSEKQGDGVTPHSVKILADMRRTAYDLDFLISRQPRHNAATAGSAPGAGPGSGYVGAAGGRYSSATPARTPQPNDLEYLDVFDFFNVPRLPDRGTVDQVMGMNGGGVGSGMAGANEAKAEVTTGGAVDGGLANEFNITDFMVDANRDWLYQDGGAPKF